jgi:hypothetical protein
MYVHVMNWKLQMNLKLNNMYAYEYTHTNMNIPNSSSASSGTEPHMRGTSKASIMYEQTVSKGILTPISYTNMYMYIFIYIY